MATQIKLRRDTAANWSANSTVVLAAGEIGVDLTNGAFKLGNGISVWSELDYFEPGAGAGSNVTTGAIAPVSPELGDLWYDTLSGRMYVYYNNTWVDSNPVIGVDRVIADSPPANSHGAIGDRVGMIAVGAGYLYICTTDYTDGVADIWSRTAIAATSW